MPIPLLLALGALVCIGAGDAAAKRGQTEDIPPPVFLFYQAAAFAVLVLVVAVRTEAWRGLTPAVWAYGLGAGLLLGSGLAAFLACLRCSDASVTVPIFRLSFVITAVLAFVLLKEPLGIAKLGGLVLAAASMLVFVTRSPVDDRPRGRAGWLWLAFAVLTTGATGVVVRRASLDGSASVPLLLVQQVPVLLCAATGALFAGRLRLSRRAASWAGLCGAIQAVGGLLLFAALARGEASIAVPVAQLSFILTALLAACLLGERLTRAKYAGLALAVLAVGAFALA